MIPIAICSECGIRWLASVITRNGNMQCWECKGLLDISDAVRIYVLFPEVVCSQKR
jgi:hypothetical protein